MNVPTPITLVTGFEPFEDAAVNPSREIALALDGVVIAGHRVVGAVLPTSFARALPTLDALLLQHRPAVVIAFGVADRRAQVSLERVAVNLIDARIADNDGAQPVDVRVVENAPNAYFSTLPVKAMLQRLQSAGIPAALSQSAGSFVCNQVFFGLCNLLAARHPGTRGGFVHVPQVPDAARDGAAGIALPTLIEAARLCVETGARVHDDLHFPAGATQ